MIAAAVVWTAAVVLATAITGDQTVLLVCTLISAVLGPVMVVVVSNRTGRSVARKVEAVHHEIRPPSNGTTAGAQLEFTAGWIAWLYEELVAIGGRLGMTPHGPPPEMPFSEPPIRPGERRRVEHPEIPKLMPEEQP